MGLSPDDAQDAVQEAFLKLFRYLGRYRSGESFTGWFYRIVVHATYDQMRRARHREALSLDAAALGEGPPDPGPGAAEAAETAHLRRRVQAAMSALAAQERAAFVLRELHGLETRAVARALRVTQVTVRRHVSNARRKLRERLEGEFPDLFRPG
jgi:RNA polymerase sigma-70 factor (ECF subfamily)